MSKYLKMLAIPDNSPFHPITEKYFLLGPSKYKNNVLMGAKSKKSFP